METLAPTSHIRAVRDVVEDPREGVEDRVDETNRALTDGETFLVNL